MDWLHYAIDFAVIGFLAFMSVVAVAVAIERKIFFRRVRLDDYTDRRELELDLIRRLRLGRQLTSGLFGLDAPRGQKGDQPVPRLGSIAAHQS